MKLKIPMIDESIFREYDIRGVVPSKINEASIGSISYAIAKKCKDENITEIALIQMTLWIFYQLSSNNLTYKK